MLRLSTGVIVRDELQHRDRASTVGGPINEDEAEIRQLIESFKSGDERAFAELVRRYRGQVASLAYKMVGDYDEAADIAQTVFLKMSKNLWRYDPKRRFYTWLHRITVNAAIDHIRKHQRHRHEPIEDLHESLESSGDGPDYSYNRDQIRRYLASATDSLNAKQRSAFVLRDVEGCPVDDVAEIMQMPQATVRWYLHRARERIRRDLLRRCPHLLILLGIK